MTEVSQLPDGRWELGTSAGRSIRAGRVVNASGFWAKELSAKFGASVPLVPIHHQYLVTKTVPEVRDGLGQELPVLRHLEVRLGNPVHISSFNLSCGCFLAYSDFSFFFTRALSTCAKRGTASSSVPTSLRRA